MSVFSCLRWFPIIKKVKKVINRKSLKSTVTPLTLANRAMQVCCILYASRHFQLWWCKSVRLARMFFSNNFFVQILNSKTYFFWKSLWKAIDRFDRCHGLGLAGSELERAERLSKGFKFTTSKWTKNWIEAGHAQTETENYVRILCCVQVTGRLD